MKAALVLLALAAGARADSVEMTDKTTIYGRIVEMSATELIISGRFPTPSGDVEVRRIPIWRTLISKIEFNQATFNPGGPPAAGAGAVPPGAGVTPPRAGVSRGYAVLVGTPRQQCDDATIDVDHNLLCGTDAGAPPLQRITLTFPQSSVIRIFLATK